MIRFTDIDQITAADSCIDQDETVPSKYVGIANCDISH